MRAGDPAAKPALASMLYEDAGRGVVQFAELQEAAELGHPGAMSQLGQVYLRGEGIPGDPVRGRIWLERAIEAGNLHAAQTLGRSEEHTSELQSLMRISYAVFCLKKK